jgi:5'-3' exonuclease
MPIIKIKGSKSKHDLDKQKLIELIKLSKVECVIVEKLQSIYGISKGTNIKLLQQYSFIEGVCLALGIQFESVTAKTWQKYIFDKYRNIADNIVFDDINIKETKLKSLAIAPVIYKELTGKDIDIKKTQDGLADAICIMKYKLDNDNLKLNL